MELITSAGTTLAIGTTAPATTIADFEEDTYQEVGDVEDLGEVGDDAEIVTIVTLADARVRKAKGARDAGDMQVVVGWNPDDDGQQDMDEAEATNNTYNFRLQRDDQIDPATGNPTTQYFRALVMSNRKNYGQQNNIQRVTYVLAVTSPVLTEEAS